MLQAIEREARFTKANNVSKIPTIYLTNNNKDNLFSANHLQN